MWHKVFFLFFFLTSWVQAQELSLKSSAQSQNSYLGVSGLGSLFKLDAGDVNGIGAKIEYSHFFSNNYSFDVDLQSAMNFSENGLQNSFTGMSVHVNYTLFGECCNQVKNTTVNDFQLLQESHSLNSHVVVGLGLEQLFLNGAKSIYSASGLNAQIKYRLNYYKVIWQLEGRASYLISGEHQITGVGIGIGAIFPL